MSDHDYNIFISYRSTDRVWVSFLKTNLESIEGYRVFVDKSAIPPGTNYTTEIIKTLLKCSKGIFIIPKQGEDTTWIKDELDKMINQANSDDGYSFVPVRIHDQQADLPLLTGKQILDLRCRNEEDYINNFTHLISGLEKTHPDRTPTPDITFTFPSFTNQLPPANTLLPDIFKYIDCRPQVDALEIDLKNKKKNQFKGPLFCLIKDDMEQVPSNLVWRFKNVYQIIYKTVKSNELEKHVLNIRFNNLFDEMNELDESIIDLTTLNTAIMSKSHLHVLWAQIDHRHFTKLNSDRAIGNWLKQWKDNNNILELPIIILLFINESPSPTEKQKGIVELLRNIFPSKLSNLDRMVKLITKHLSEDRLLSLDPLKSITHSDIQIWLDHHIKKAMNDIHSYNLYESYFLKLITEKRTITIFDFLYVHTPSLTK
ncbi:MAG: toll/interleukin-1 receptor domain-containing protein [Magnetococcales bacterium]|nr:toll/interleukin-1 receptor domain-containing protein [Magnetococcales bacterium]